MPANASICLRLNDDLLCNAVLAHGHWPECADLPELYRRARADGGIVVDAGANIGACTLHMLLTTDAHVLAFEPGADNLFYFSSSLMQLREFFTNAEQHLQLYPLAVGAANVSDELHATIGNAGHSVIGQRPALYAPRGHKPPQAIVVRTMDDVLWPRSQRSLLPPTVSLLKLDVEGYECKALQGMAALLAARAIRLIKTEVFEYGLRAQGCSAIELQRSLQRAGFSLFLSPPKFSDRPISAEVVYSSGPYNLYCFIDWQQGREWPISYANPSVSTQVGSVSTQLGSVSWLHNQHHRRSGVRNRSAWYKPDRHT